MAVLKHELRQGRNAFFIWTAIIAFMLGICIFIYPEMEDQMSEISGVFAEMGSFSAAFGMDRINFGEFSGYFGVECGNILGLGGAFHAALLGILALAKEEKERTAEFLLTHPVSRRRVIIQKLCAVFIQITAFHAAVIGVTVLSSVIVGESMDKKIFMLLFLAYFILQIEIAAVCFGISAFISRSGIGIGLGMAALFYFLNIISNLTKQAEVLKYITPFGYTDSADIITNGSIEIKYLFVGLVFAIIGILAAFWKYGKKDII